MDTRKGIVRSEAGGEHPTLGRLTPGDVLDVPANLWSDALFAPVAGDSPVELPAVAPEALEGLDQRLQAAQDRVGDLEAMQAQTQAVAAQAAAVQVAMDELRGVSRQLRALEARIATRQAEAQADLAAMRRDLSLLLLDFDAAARRLATLAAPPAPAPPEAEPTQAAPVAESAQAPE
jgi:hypothetical protein